MAAPAANSKFTKDGGAGVSVVSETRAFGTMRVTGRQPCSRLWHERGHASGMPFALHRKDHPPGPTRF